MQGFPLTVKEGGEESVMKLIGLIIKILHTVSIIGTCAAITELVLTAIVEWLSH